MEWPLMSNQEVHAFGIEATLPYLAKEGVTVESVDHNPKKSPQVVGQRWGSLAFVFVRTALYPNKGELGEAEFMRCLALAKEHRATAFFASVGIACMNYPDKLIVENDTDMKLPIRNGGFAVSYDGLVVMTTSDRVRVWGQED